MTFCTPQVREFHPCQVVFSFSSFFFIREHCETLMELQRSDVPTVKCEVSQEQKQHNIYGSVFLHTVQEAMQFVNVPQHFPFGIFL